MRMFLRMSRWARNPPTEKRVIFVFSVIAICLVIGLVEWLGLWPDWATADKLKR